MVGACAACSCRMIDERRSENADACSFDISGLPIVAILYR
jgi:hypothetical protein